MQRSPKEKKGQKWCEICFMVYDPSLVPASLQPTFSSKKYAWSSLILSGPSKSHHPLIRKLEAGSRLFQNEEDVRRVDTWDPWLEIGLGSIRSHLLTGENGGGYADGSGMPSGNPDGRCVYSTFRACLNYEEDTHVSVALMRRTVACFRRKWLLSQPWADLWNDDNPTDMTPRQMRKRIHGVKSCRVVLWSLGRRRL